MPSKICKVTFRVREETLNKLRYIADDNFRTINKELEMIVVQHIINYEESHDKELDEKLSSYAKREELSKNQVVKKAIRNLVEAPEEDVPKFGTTKVVAG